MDKNSNSYIIIYATVMVVIVALLLAFASGALKERQNANEENEMKSAILYTIGEGQEANKALDKTQYINDQYEKYIRNSYAVDVDGNLIEGVSAFDILKELKAEYDKPEQERELPVFVSQSDDGTTRYVLPVYGNGLWGPIWGYVALESDWNTIYGVVFDHQGETPGLGAEIATAPFANQFKGKTIYDGDRLVSISVLKGVGSSNGNIHAVDAISGGTITSRAVETMLTRGLKGYNAYIQKMNSGEQVTDVVTEDINNEDNIENNE